MIKVKKNTVLQQHLLGIAILVAFLLPHSSTLFLLMNPILCLLMVAMNRNRLWSSYVMIVVVPIVVSMMFNMGVASQKAFMSTFTILLYFSLFPFVGQSRVRNIYLYICLGYIFISQLVYLLGIPFLTSFFDQFYPVSEDYMESDEYKRNNITYLTMFDYRLGGLYHNSNQCSKYLTALLAFFLVNNQGQRGKGVIGFLAIAYAGVLLTGSRTGFVISSLILYFGFLRQKRYAGNVRYLFIALGVIGIGYILSTGSSLRGLDIESGFENSANSKWDTFLYYLSTENSIISLLFGHIDVSLFEGQYGLAMGNFDSEYGSLFYRFGAVGFIGILYFYWATFLRLEKEKRFFFIYLVWMVSSTIVASYRTFFVFMLLLSVIYANYRKKIT